MKKNVGCKHCGTVLGESTTEWRLGVPIIAIQPYLTHKVKDGIIDCPNCSSKVDVTVPTSIIGQLSLTMQSSQSS